MQKLAVHIKGNTLKSIIQKSPLKNAHKKKKPQNSISTTQSSFIYNKKKDVSNKTSNYLLHTLTWLN